MSIGRDRLPGVRSAGQTVPQPDRPGTEPALGEARIAPAQPAPPADDTEAADEGASQPGAEPPTGVGRRRPRPSAEDAEGSGPWGTSRVDPTGADDLGRPEVDGRRAVPEVEFEPGRTGPIAGRSRHCGEAQAVGVGLERRCNPATRLAVDDRQAHRDRRGPRPAHAVEARIKAMAVGRGPADGAAGEEGSEGRRAAVDRHGQVAVIRPAGDEDERLRAEDRDPHRVRDGGRHRDVHPAVDAGDLDPRLDEPAADR